MEILRKILEDWDMVNYLINNKLRLSRETLAVYREVNEFLNEFYELFYKFELERLSMFGRKRYELVDRFGAMFDKCDKKEIMVLLYLYTVVDNVFDMNGALMAVRL